MLFLAIHDINMNSIKFNLSYFNCSELSLSCMNFPFSPEWGYLCKIGCSLVTHFTLDSIVTSQRHECSLKDRWQHIMKKDEKNWIMSTVFYTT